LAFEAENLKHENLHLSRFYVEFQLYAIGVALNHIKEIKCDRLEYFYKSRKGNGS